VPLKLTRVVEFRRIRVVTHVAGLYGYAAE